MLTTNVSNLSALDGVSEHLDGSFRPNSEYSASEAPSSTTSDSESGHAVHAVQPISPLVYGWSAHPVVPDDGPGPPKGTPVQVARTPQAVVQTARLSSALQRGPPPTHVTPTPSQPGVSATTQKPPVRHMATGAPAPMESIVHVYPQNGDVALYGTPITQSALVKILTLQYGPVMYCIPITEITGGHAVRMQDLPLHQRMANELHGALLNNGACLYSGIVKIASAE